MKIRRLYNTVMLDSQVKADIYIDPRTGTTHYNLKHGSRGNNTWQWYAGISPVHIDISGDDVTLTGDNYKLEPVYKRGRKLKDSAGNQCYNLVTDNDPSHTSDVLLLWMMPCWGKNNVSYSMTGCVEEIGKGFGGKYRGDADRRAHAPVLEIYGDCELRWEGTDSNGHKYQQIITYSAMNETFNIGTMERIDV